MKYGRQNHNGFRAAKARNNGVRYSSNEFLVFYDQDIISTKNYLQIFVDNASLEKFIVSYPIRLSKFQSESIHPEIIESFNFDDILLPRQIQKIKKQFLKDYYSYLKRNWGLARKGPKLRSGVFDIIRIGMNIRCICIMKQIMRGALG